MIRTGLFLVCIFVCVFAAILASPLAARDDVPMPQPMGPPATKTPRSVLVGPGDAPARVWPVSGKVPVVANVPATVKPAEVDILVDGKSIGKGVKRPYRAELDASGYASGEHVVKAIGRDAEGKEVWSASTRVKVGDAPATAPNAAGNDGTNGNAPAAEIIAPVTQESHPAVSALSLDKTYLSSVYGFSVKHPGRWSVRDETENVTPKSPGEFWLVIGTDPTVINLHGKKLSPGTDAERFAKYYTYVQKWERKSILGSPAFASSDGTPASRRVVHRLIVIKDGFAWMLNCIDTTGGSPDVSAGLLEEVAKSIQPTKPASSGERVKITEIKAKP